MPEEKKRTRPCPICSRRCDGHVLGIGILYPCELLQKIDCVISIPDTAYSLLSENPGIRRSAFSFVLETAYNGTSERIRFVIDKQNTERYQIKNINGAKWRCINLCTLNGDPKDPELLDMELLNLFHADLLRPFQLPQYLEDCGLQADLLACNNERKAVEERLNDLAAFGYMVKMGTTQKNPTYHPTEKAWSRAEELLEGRSSGTCFVICSFDGNSKEISSVLCRVVKNTGSVPVRIDPEEYGGQLVPEIGESIKRSEFVLADLTFGDPETYYETGLAKGMGKNIICCCREDEFLTAEGRPKFDDTMQSVVVWKDYEDLRKKLKERIETVTARPH